MSEHITQQGCPNKFCSNRGKNDDIAVHDKKRNRLRCKICGKTWSAHYGEFHYGLRAEPAKIRRAIDLLKVKIPIRTIARFVKVSPSTILRWKKKLLDGTQKNTSLMSLRGASVASDEAIFSIS